MPQQAMPPVSYASSSQCQEEFMMYWSILADIVRTLAAGVTAVIAGFKFIQELRQRRRSQSDYPQPGYLEKGNDDEPKDRPR
jgi:hypothetical protein